jgi:hypothetical protein
MEYDPPVLRRIISFAPTIEVAETWAADFNDAGIHTECVFGSTPPEVRRRSYERLAKGEIDCISSVMVLTEGFDLPAVEVAVIGRPTKSLPLYIQMVGRVLRPSPETGKQGALVLDVCGTMTDALVTLSDLRLPKRCKCECDCRYTDECGGACRCRPKCPVCDKYGWPLSACQHYGEHHTIRCIHHCRTPAKPKDLLDGEGFMPEGVEFDGASIELRATKLFDKPKKATKSWRMTYGGLPYLPTFDDDDSEDVLVFLFQESDETWTVGRGAKGAKNLPVEKGLNFSQAVALAESIHPYGCRLMPKLSGSASPGQVGLLQRNQIEVQEGLTKNEASLMIGDLIASQRTGWRR